MSTFGEREAARPIAKRLREVFGPDSPLDCDVLARHIADDLDVTAIKVMDARERALQEALAASMAYMGDVNETQRQRIRQLEDRLAVATLAAVKRTTS